MRTSIDYLADRLRHSFWFLPAVLSAGAIGLSFGTLALDRSVSFGEVLLYSGGPDGAREVLGAIAGSMITVAGVVFSITIVALTLASSQFGPRMLDNFVRDRGNQLTLGTFIATFLYALMVLRTIRSDADAVPTLSVTVALLLTIAALSVLIYFVHHIATTIQAPQLVARIGRELVDGVDRIFPESDELTEGELVAVAVPEPDGPSSTVLAADSGYVQLVDLDALLALAAEHDLVVRLDTRPGRFVVQGRPVATAWPVQDDAVLGRVSSAITTGARRTPLQDVEFPARQLTEVAVRALSPAINDPFTASTCVHQLSVGLCRLAGRRFPPTQLADPAGRVRVVLGESVGFADLVASAYDQIRQCAAHHAAVYVSLLEALTRVAGCARAPERLEALERQADLVLRAAERAVPDEADRSRVHAGFEDFVDAVAAGRAAGRPAS